MEEFDATVQLDIYQALPMPKKKGSEAEDTTDGKPEKEKRVGRAIAIFHATPKLHQKSRGRLP